jgi:hypothetical protein
MKNLFLAIVLAVMNMTFSIDASAKIDAATLERQRTANKARLEKAQGLRAGKKERRLFNKSESSGKDMRSLKLDAIPPSPRHSASGKQDQNVPASPKRTTTKAKTERKQGTVPAKTE